MLATSNKPTAVVGKASRLGRADHRSSLANSGGGVKEQGPFNVITWHCFFFQMCTCRHLQIMLPVSSKMMNFFFPSLPILEVWPLPLSMRQAQTMLSRSQSQSKSCCCFFFSKRGSRVSFSMVSDALNYILQQNPRYKKQLPFLHKCPHRYWLTWAHCSKQPTDLCRFFHPAAG